MCLWGLFGSTVESRFVKQLTLCFSSNAIDLTITYCFMNNNLDLKMFILI